MSGDEFAAIAPAATQPAKAAALAERLLASFADEMTINAQPLRVGLSIGVAMFPDDGMDADTLMANADAALVNYAAVYQINVTLPAGLPNGELPIVAEVGGASSPDGFTISVQN